MYSATAAIAPEQDNLSLKPYCAGHSKLNLVVQIQHSFVYNLLKNFTQRAQEANRSIISLVIDFIDAATFLTFRFCNHRPKFKIIDRMKKHDFSNKRSWCFMKFPW